jgi:hypothetical protein
LEYFIRDGRGGTARGFVVIRTTRIVTKVLSFAARGGAGDPVTLSGPFAGRLPAGTTLVGFGQPASAYGDTRFRAWVREPGGAFRQAILVLAIPAMASWR